MADPRKEQIKDLRFFEAAVSLLAACAFLYAAYEAATGLFNPEWLVLTGITVFLVSRIDIKLLKTSSGISLTESFIFLAVILYGAPLAVLLAGLDAAIGLLQHQEPRKRTPAPVATAILSISIAGGIVELTASYLQSYSTSWGYLSFILLLLALTHFIVNSLLTSAAQALRFHYRFVEVWKEALWWTALSYFVAAAAACLLVKLIHTVSFFAFIVAVPILSITWLTYKVYLDKVEASNAHAEEVADLHLRTIEALAIAIDAKDEVTHDHVRRVQIYATGLARLFGLSDTEIEALKAGALLHDIGKLAVPDYILNKPGPLTPAEFEKMKIHTVVGAEILERVGFPYPVVPVVRHHHERWDGRGYPDALRGDEIPITARILTVSDCFDAVQEERQYRLAFTRDDAIAMLKEGRGTVFDPNVVSTFLEHLKDFEAEIRDQGLHLQSNTSRGKPAINDRQREVSKLESGQLAYDHIRNARREVITLYEIAQTIGTSLDLRDTFAVFSSRLLDIVSYTTCILYLLKHNSTDIEAAHVAGRNADKLKGKRMPAGIGIAGWVVANRTAMHNSDPRLDFEAMRSDISEPYSVATVVPVMQGDNTIGALALYDTERTAFDMDDLRVVESVATLSADAIANAVRHNRTEETALTDMLTSLPNARALRYRFEEDADRARRHRDTFCVVMMDLDGFKEVNDKLGHYAGDQLLMEISRLLLAQVRSSDFIARYAGDEFVAILQVSPEEAREMIQRLQKAVERHDFKFPVPDLTVGVSAGMATFEIDGNTLDELLLAADRAMYTDKMMRKSKAAEAKREGSKPLNTADLRRFKIV